MIDLNENNIMDMIKIFIILIERLQEAMRENNYRKHHRFIDNI